MPGGFFSIFEDDGPAKSTSHCSPPRRALTATNGRWYKNGRRRLSMSAMPTIFPLGKMVVGALLLIVAAALIVRFL
jgi:hypothetical protein